MLDFIQNHSELISIICFVLAGSISSFAEECKRSFSVNLLLATWNKWWGVSIIVEALGGVAVPAALATSIHLAESFFEGILLWIILSAFISFFIRYKLHQLKLDYSLGSDSSMLASKETRVALTYAPKLALAIIALFIGLLLVASNGSVLFLIGWGLVIFPLFPIIALVFSISHHYQGKGIVVYNAVLVIIGALLIIFNWQENFNIGL